MLRLFSLHYLSPEKWSIKVESYSLSGRGLGVIVKMLYNLRSFKLINLVALTGVVGYVDGAAQEGDSGERCDDDRKLHSLN